MEVPLSSRIAAWILGDFNKIQGKLCIVMKNDKEWGRWARIVFASLLRQVQPQDCRAYGGVRMRIWRCLEIDSLSATSWLEICVIKIWLLNNNSRSTTVFHFQCFLSTSILQLIITDRFYSLISSSLSRTSYFLTAWYLSTPLSFAHLS